MAICILRFLNGSGCRTWVIAHVTIDDNGVACYDSNNNLLGRVDTTDTLAQQRVADAIMDCLDAGKGFKQPDFEKLIRGVTA
jgi:hypothetical protein